MIIAVYVPFLAKRSLGDFIVETFFPLLELWPVKKMLLITDDKIDLEIKLTKTEILTIKPQPRNPLLKKLWIERTLMGVVKQNKADLFISADNFCSLKTSLPQALLAPDPGKIKLVHAKKARVLIALSKSEKQRIINKFKIEDNKVVVIYPSPNKKYLTIDSEQKESIKSKYTDNKEFFLFNSNFHQEEDLINLLKSFSHFKKRQQSSFKFLILSTPASSFEKSIESYKYRNDVIILKTNVLDEKAMITAAAYAVVFPFNANENIGAALNVMQSGVPVITTKDSSINEIAGDAVLYSENEIKDIGEKMMLLYKDENLRYSLIQKGKELVKNFNEEKSAGHLWQSIMKAAN
jgi:glycosyltransferase involved in cell wall biosynthesis